MTVIDLHSHILPRADHGSQSTETSVSQLALMKRFGTDIAVATPHFYPNKHTLEVFEGRVERALGLLKDACVTDKPRLCVGAEVLFCDNIEKMPSLERLCIKGTRVLLLELPFAPLSDRHVETVEELIKHGYTVVLAHIDRYLSHSAPVIDEMLSRGALAQINAEAFYKLRKRAKVMRYVRDTDKVVALGSDLHGDAEKDYRKFARLEKKLKADVEKIMARTASLLEGAEYAEI